MAVFRMARPMRRKGSSKEQFRVRIPFDVLDVARGEELTLTVGGVSVVKKFGPRADVIGLSLRTNDPREVKLRQASVLQQVELLFSGLRQRQAPISLSHEHCVRLAGDFYRAWTDGGPDAGVLRELETDELEAAWSVAAERLGEAVELGYQRAIRGLRRLAERFLLARGMSVDERSLDRLCEEIVKALRDAAKTNATKAAGDYGAGDGLGERFGSPWRPGTGEQPAASQGSGSGKTAGPVSLRSLVQGWRDDPQTASSPATHSAYLAAVERFIALVGHDDAKRITQANVLEFRKHRLKQVSPKTVRDGDIAALKSILGWAVQEQLLDGPNPAAAIQ
jgi:hypothetical protein